MRSGEGWHIRTICFCQDHRKNGECVQLSGSHTLSTACEGKGGNLPHRKKNKKQKKHGTIKHKSSQMPAKSMLNDGEHTGGSGCTGEQKVGIHFDCWVLSAEAPGNGWFLFGCFSQKPVILDQRGTLCRCLVLTGTPVQRKMTRAESTSCKLALRSTHF